MKTRFLFGRTNDDMVKNKIGDHSHVLHLEARLPPLIFQFQLLTVKSIVCVVSSPFIQQAGANPQFLNRYFLVWWHHIYTFPNVFVQTL